MPGLMKVYKSIFEGVVPIVINRKRLSHPNQPRHINVGYEMALVSATVARLKQSSLSSNDAPRRPPLKKPHPFWTTTAIRALTPAAEEVVAILSPPNQAA